MILVSMIIRIHNNLVLKPLSQSFLSILSVLLSQFHLLHRHHVVVYSDERFRFLQCLLDQKDRQCIRRNSGEALNIIMVTDYCE